MTTDIESSLKNNQSENTFYTQLLLRIRILQFVIFIAVFYFLVIPIFRFIQFIFQSGRVNISSTNAYIVFLLPLVSIGFLTILLVIGVLNSRLLWLYKIFILLSFINIIYTETNPFIIAFEFSITLFLYEIPFITQYYGSFIKNYQNYPSNHTFELQRLQILFDEHVSYILALCAILLSLTWFFIIALGIIQLDIGEKASIIFPIIIMMVCIGILYVRPDFSKTVFKRYLKKINKLEKKSLNEEPVLKFPLTKEEWKLDESSNPSIKKS